MSEIVFAGVDAFERFAAFVERRAAEVELPFIAAADLISHKLHENTTKVYGDESKLRELEESTKAQRDALGYSTDEPLLRDGSLLRDSVERESFDTTAAVGSSEPIAGYHEFGFFNVRAQRFIEPRPAFEIGLHETEPEAEEIVNEAIGAAFGFGPLRRRED